MSKEQMPAWQLTIGELKKIVHECLSENPIPFKSQEEKKYVYGIKGIQKLLNCSESSAKRLKNSGVINDAIIQNGRKIILDVEKALVLLKENQTVGRQKQ